MLCIPIIGPRFAEAQEQIFKAAFHADLLEFRIDLFKKISTAELAILCKMTAKPVIFTLRKTSQGGRFQGSEEERLACIEEWARLKPSFIDLEYDTDKKFIAELTRSHPEIDLILSYHDFVQTPPRLDQLLIEMKKIPAKFYKIAVKANSSLDAMRMLVLMKNNPRLIGISMGGLGLSTRILGPVLNSFFVFGSLSDRESSTSPQINVKELLDLYHFRALNPKTAIYALIGDPIDKSISHITHNKVFQMFGLNAVYIKFQLAIHEIEEFLELCKILDFKGLSVTMPLKEAVLPFLNQLKNGVRNIGAANTLIFKKEGIIGYNTDGQGAADAIEEHIKLEGKKVIVLGAGGASRAIIYEVIKRKGQVVVLNRTREKAEQLAKHFGCRAGDLQQMAGEAADGYDVLINATSHELPIPPDWILSSCLVMEVKTQPKKTLFLQEALGKQCRIVYGYEMFVNQAATQFEIWFGKKIHSEEAKRYLTLEAENLI